ncbi:MAG: hypothetical protein CM1200mP9_10000 [Gammaproteobacteria bacterium]|nr:MAG: hypothetical protein CM1200mP9_10000 [Gammaproteobacteria bacterium]
MGYFKNIVGGGLLCTPSFVLLGLITSPLGGGHFARQNRTCASRVSQGAIGPRIKYLEVLGNPRPASAFAAIDAQYRGTFLPKALGLKFSEAFRLATAFQRLLCCECDRHTLWGVAPSAATSQAIR